MTVEALPRIQQPQTYIGPEETTWRNRAFQIVAIVGALLGAGLFLASFYTAIPWLVGAGVTALSLFALHSICTASSNLVEHAEKGNQCMVNFLLFLGANPNSRNWSRVNPYSLLFSAIRSQQENSVEQLLNHGANPHWANPPNELAGISCLDFAERIQNRLANPEFDPAVGCLSVAVGFNCIYTFPAKSTRTLEERKATATRIVELLQTHTQPVEE